MAAVIDTHHSLNVTSAVKTVPMIHDIYHRFTDSERAVIDLLGRIREFKNITNVSVVDVAALAIQTTKTPTSSEKSVDDLVFAKHSTRNTRTRSMTYSLSMKVLDILSRYTPLISPYPFNDGEKLASFLCKSYTHQTIENIEHLVSALANTAANVPNFISSVFGSIPTAKASGILKTIIGMFSRCFDEYYISPKSNMTETILNFLNVLHPIITSHPIRDTRLVSVLYADTHNSCSVFILLTNVLRTVLVDHTGDVLFGELVEKLVDMCDALVTYDRTNPSACESIYENYTHHDTIMTFCHILDAGITNITVVEKTLNMFVHISSSKQIKWTYHFLITTILAMLNPECKMYRHKVLDVMVNVVFRTNMISVAVRKHNPVIDGNQEAQHEQAEVQPKSMESLLEMFDNLPLVSSEIMNYDSNACENMLNLMPALIQSAIDDHDSVALERCFIIIIRCFSAVTQCNMPPCMTNMLGPILKALPSLSELVYSDTLSLLVKIAVNDINAFQFMLTHSSNDIMRVFLNAVIINNTVSFDIIDALMQLYATSKIVLRIRTLTDSESVDDVCSMCVNPFRPGNKVITLPCHSSHTFHIKAGDCEGECVGIERWMMQHNKCPLCNTVMPELNEVVASMCASADNSVDSNYSIIMLALESKRDPVKVLNGLMAVPGALEYVCNLTSIHPVSMFMRASLLVALSILDNRVEVLKAGGVQALVRIIVSTLGTDGTTPEFAKLILLEATSGLLFIEQEICSRTFETARDSLLVTRLFDILKIINNDSPNIETTFSLNRKLDVVDKTIIGNVMVNLVKIGKYCTTNSIKLGYQDWYIQAIFDSIRWTQFDESRALLSYCTSILLSFTIQHSQSVAKYLRSIQGMERIFYLIKTNISQTAPVQHLLMVIVYLINMSQNMLSKFFALDGKNLILPFMTREQEQYISGIHNAIVRILGCMCVDSRCDIPKGVIFNYMYTSMKDRTECGIVKAILQASSAIIKMKPELKMEMVNNGCISWLFAMKTYADEMIANDIDVITNSFISLTQ